MADSNSNNRGNDFEEALRQFIDARMRGEKPDIDAFVNKYPEFEDQIRQKVQSFRKIDALFDSVMRSEENDFVDAATGDDLVGQKVGSFEIVEKIGQGGMGVVYLAHDTKLDRSVAVKSIPTELQASSTTRTRFRREAKLLASLNHPNIAVIHDIIEEDKSGYLILEYIPGQTLAERIAREPLEFEEALSIAQQVAEAISVAHKNSIVHRDLKPGNIKITPDGRIKVLDFGLAKASVSEDKNVENTVTQPGRVMGTPAYMSPEQVRGKDTDHRTDIWSFGCIMYEMLTGRLPFEGETATDTLARIIERQPDWDLLPQSTPMNVRVLLRRCLEKNPQQRLGDITNAALEIRETLSSGFHTESASAPAVPTKLRKMAMIFGVVIIIVLSAIAVRFIPQQQAQPSSKVIRLVVLPFENLGSVEDEYFADGITNDIIARLVDIRSLGVISAMQYNNREQSAKQMVKELYVDYILQGTIHREQSTDPNSRVRITPQLINTTDDTLVWTKAYETTEIVRIQSDIAEQVAQALDIVLLEPERHALKTRPTENMEAYEYYLRGNDYFYRGYLQNDFRIAIQMYEKAVELDPKFALAYTDLSKVHAKMYWFNYDPNEERIAMAKQAVDEAIRLNPDLPEAHIALGFYYYWCHLDYGHALEEFAIARKSQPNNSELLKGIGAVQRRQGKFEQALANFRKVSELAPLSNVAAYNVGHTFMLLRKYQEAESYYERAILLRPDWSDPYARKAELYLRWEGSTEKARAVMERALQNVKSAEDHNIVDMLITLDVYDGNYQQGLDRLSLKSEDIDGQFHFIPNSLQCAQIYGYMNKDDLAKKYYDEARSILEAKIQERHEDSRFHSSLGIAYAGLGRKEDAIREGKIGVKLHPVSKEAMRGPFRVENLARIYVMVDEHDAAIDELEFLLYKPGWISIPLLRLDPAWDPLCDHPRFKKLVETGK